MPYIVRVVPRQNRAAARWAKPVDGVTNNGTACFHEDWAEEKEGARRFTSLEQAKAMSRSITGDCERTIYRLAGPLEQLAGLPTEEVVFEDSWGPWD